MKKNSILILLIISFYSNFVKAIKLNEKAPNFELHDDKGKLRSLREFLGKKVVVYFYPKDDSFYCTKQACNFQDSLDLFKKNNITLIGVNYDSIESHRKFKIKYGLQFILLSDLEGTVTKKYEVNKGMFGWLVPQRKTFLINEKGYIIHIFNKVNIASQFDDILKKYETQIYN